MRQNQEKSLSKGIDACSLERRLKPVQQTWGAGMCIDGVRALESMRIPDDDGAGAARTRI